MSDIVMEKIVDIENTRAYCNWDEFCGETVIQATNAISRPIVDNASSEACDNMKKGLIASQRIIKLYGFITLITIIGIIMSCSRLTAIINISLVLAGSIIALSMLAFGIFGAGGASVITRKIYDHKEMFALVGEILEPKQIIFNRLQPGTQESNRRHLKILFMKCVYEVITGSFQRNIILTDKEKTICHYCHVLSQNSSAFFHHTYECLDHGNEHSKKSTAERIYFNGKLIQNSTDRAIIADVEHKSETEPVHNSISSSSSTAHKCSLCLIQTSNVAFLPCGHVATCEECSVKIEKCVLCRLEHRQIIGKQFDEIENDRDQFYQRLAEQKQVPRKIALIQKVNKWEEDSIKKIKQTAEECRQMVIKHSSTHFIEIENNLSQLTERLKQIREENEFNEADLNIFKTQLMKIAEELDESPNIKIEYDSGSFIDKISILVSAVIANIHVNATWKPNGMTVAGGNGPGSATNKLTRPMGIFVDDDDQTIVIADCANDRIIQWKIGDTNGQVVAGGNGYGNGLDQVELPKHVLIDKETNSLIILGSGFGRIFRWSRRSGTRQGEILFDKAQGSGLAMDDQRYVYVSYFDEVRRYQLGKKTMDGTLVAGGNGEGSGLNQFKTSLYIFVDRQQAVYISDDQNHRVMKWNKGAKEGVVVAGGQGSGNSLTQLSSPRGLFVDHLGTLYVVEAGNNRVTRWPQGAKQGTIVVGEDAQLSEPEGLFFDRQGNFYVADCGNHRVQRFSI
ncbi:unnamed protein product [Rotaria sordida]|uniref:RING-type domain-containing protein n=1 Tax=Rotaria sordida TaxID=392033 RepID=A0A815D3G9_9BILA|nr:unnamed protein product [Rotaria sordida]